MDTLQVATDYAEEEGFQITRNAEGQWIEIHHPQGGARVQKDGTVLCETNSRLKQVLEKKLAQSRAKEAQLIEDPEGRVTIKFSAEYEKMPSDISQTTLLAVLKVKRSQLSPQFLEWDTKFRGKEGSFPLSSAQDVLVPMLLSAPEPTVPRNPWLEQPSLWTTIRAAWPPEKEGFYRSHVGELVNIEIKGGNA
ncbi:MAG: hypothetical protein AB9879_09835 [Methanothrix sp.]